MSIRLLAFIAIAMLLLGEIGLAIWRNAPVPATGPILTFPPAAAKFDNPGAFASSIAAYGADRGAELHKTTPDDIRLTTFYFEWDEIRKNWSSEITRHQPEVCNVAAGFNFVGNLEQRTFEIPGYPPLVFDATRFTTPGGRDVHIFKLPWVQGMDSLELLRDYDHGSRLRGALSRHTGAARVLQTGIHDADDADHAWQIFEDHVLTHLEWQDP